jgi:hypothetical protein
MDLCPESAYNHTAISEYMVNTNQWGVDSNGSEIRTRKVMVTVIDPVLANGIIFKIPVEYIFNK